MLILSRIYYSWWFWCWRKRWTNKVRELALMPDVPDNPDDVRVIASSWEHSIIKAYSPCILVNVIYKQARLTIYLDIGTGKVQLQRKQLIYLAHRTVCFGRHRKSCICTEILLRHLPLSNGWQVYTVCLSRIRVLHRMPPSVVYYFQKSITTWKSISQASEVPGEFRLRRRSERWEKERKDFAATTTASVELMGSFCSRTIYRSFLLQFQLSILIQIFIT